jgi:hypothetical protein
MRGVETWIDSKPAEPFIPGFSRHAAAAMVLMLARSGQLFIVVTRSVRPCS